LVRLAGISICPDKPEQCSLIHRCRRGNLRIRRIDNLVGYKVRYHIETDQRGKRRNLEKRQHKKLIKQ